MISAPSMQTMTTPTTQIHSGLSCSKLASAPSSSSRRSTLNITETAKNKSGKAVTKIDR